MAEPIELNWPPEEAKWVVRLLGRLEIVSANQEKPHVRSKTVALLLAYLALRPGYEFSRFLLQETFWPDSDGDRRAQNLRRAVADLRDALETDDERGQTVITRRDIVSLNPTGVTTDADRFLKLSDFGLKSGDKECLREAIGLYGGPILAGHEDDWIYAYRLEYEECYVQVLEQLCETLMDDGAAKEAIRLARAGLLLAPLREDVHCILIRAYRGAGLEAEALRQFEDLERMLDDNWGEPPSERARQALEGKKLPPRNREPLIGETLRVADSEPAGGAVPLGSKFYVRRITDAHAEACLDRQESVVLVQGPRQVGKSSLLARTLAHGRDTGMRVAITDFQTIGQSQLADESQLYRSLAHSLATQLGVQLNLQSAWNDWLGPNMNLDAILGGLLAQAEGRVCWGMDEVDALFGRPYANDFFGLLRSWHNRRALDPQGPWGKLTLILSYATEAHLFITDLNQSPFNVGVRLPIRDFSLTELEVLGGLYGVCQPADIEMVHRVTNGQPFLARRAMAFLSQGGTAFELEATSALPDGPFGDHLRGLLGIIVQDSELIVEVKKLQSGEPFSKPATRHRLIAAGILAMTSNTKDGFRVPAYGEYLWAAMR